MSFKSAWTCDECHKTDHSEESHSVSDKPLDWWRVEQEGQYLEEYDFCSIECVRSWVESRWGNGAGVVVEVSDRDVLKLATLTVELRVKRDWRVTSALWLIRLAAWLCGLGYEEAANG